MVPNQVDRDDLLPTVEELVEWAVMKAGLMRKENFGALQKVKWSRSSRTDQGVHSLASVVCFQAHCKVDHWKQDPEGIAYSHAINKCATRPGLRAAPYTLW
jgi:tRNA pseudouridine38-40 synthase